jgi:kumamolisin
MPRETELAETELTLVLCASEPLPAIQHRVHHLHLTELLKQHAAGPEAADRVQAFARKHGLRVAALDSARRTARIAGTAPALRAAFPEGAVVPAQLAGVVQFVLGVHSGGFHGRPVARRRGMPPRAAGSKTLRARDFAGAYGFPEDRDAAGQTIGLLEFGGGFRHEDIRAFCRRNQVPVPHIEVVELRGAANTPAPEHAVHEMLQLVEGEIRLAAAEEATPAMEAAQATVEVTMDIELLAALAPGAKLVVYFAPPDEQGIYHALHRAVYSEEHAPDVLSISWGEPETALSTQYMHAIDHLLLAAAHLGMTVCASSGDAGALNHSPDKLPSVNFPAGSPHCVACGGTTPEFTTDADGVASIAREVVWNSTHHHLRGATGGGVSRVFPLPAWQAHAEVPAGPTGFAGRGVPDVAGPADPRFGCELLIYGLPFASAGTSAVAPLWAALIACCNRVSGRRMGHLHPHLYTIGRNRRPGLRGVNEGENGGYAAKVGWNACTGYGTPAGASLLKQLAAARHRDETEG